MPGAGLGAEIPVPVVAGLGGRHNQETSVTDYDVF